MPSHSLQISRKENEVFFGDNLFYFTFNCEIIAKSDYNCEHFNKKLKNSDDLIKNIFTSVWHDLK